MKTVIISILFSFGLMMAFADGVAAQTSVAGEWDASFNTPGGPRSFKLVLSVDGEKLTGTAKRSAGDVPVTGTIKGDDIAFSYTIAYNGNSVTLSYVGKVSGDSMGGTVSFNENASDEWSAKRVPKPKSE